MLVDTPRIRRHIRASLAALTLLACDAPPVPAPEVVAEPASPPAPPMAPVTSEAVLPAEPRVTTGPVASEEPDEAPGRRAREIRHAEDRKRPRPVPGRPLRVAGRDLPAPVRRVDAPRGAPLGLELDAELRSRVAAGWLHDARYERASVASFERAAAELSRRGAPPALIAATRRAADDELAHARTCAALAWRYGAPPLAPDRLEPGPPRDGTMASLALDVLEEGCVNETFAALVAARCARRAAPREVRAALARIADDECRHAGLAWATLRWALSRDPAARDAVRARAAELRPSEAPSAEPAPGALAAHGRATDEDLARAWYDAWSELVDPLLDELA